MILSFGRIPVPKLTDPASVEALNKSALKETQASNVTVDSVMVYTTGNLLSKLTYSSTFHTASAEWLCLSLPPRESLERSRVYENRELHNKGFWNSYLFCKSIQTTKKGSQEVRHDRLNLNVHFYFITDEMLIHYHDSTRKERFKYFQNIFHDFILIHCLG